METGNKAHELADLRAEQEREAGISAAQNALQQNGFTVCISCGDDIDIERREALPSARRCLDCQERLERQQARKARA
ncbi:molecular chaperone DnaK [Brucella pseudogrignonensis]|uniref:TraR/DksA family transcriptional regulator n=1 Tax=Brucella pseudogrignonensis TaxID=419475 RepID=A0A7Y3WWV3_9HYPH|nr:TraR/DksA C4-type zinc finger protein [Brucella pseudogrignonensis]MCM0751935.1 molecular chaperone DnaK [Brucella pseudogrignonensis]NNV20667.1 TraR/DksA family transcriptional regulator [Brucella pseudogrignonensis]